MLTRIALLSGVALLLASAAPHAAAAQKAATIRVSARVVNSVVPEVNAATSEQLSMLAHSDLNGVNLVNRSKVTEGGIAQLFTEKLPPEPVDPESGQQNPQPANAEVHSHDCVRLTVAYTAN
jgi:hypothetical protein